MNFLKRFQKMKSEYQLLLLAGIFVILVGIFWPRPTNFSAGVSAHLGNLRGSFNIEAFDTNSKQKTFALFYAPWCGHCKRFMPVWDKFWRENKDRTDVTITKINCDENKDFAKKAGISGFPTLKYYPEGFSNLDVSQVFKRAGDNGEADLSALTGFLKSVAGTPDRRSYQAGNIKGDGPPVKLDGAPIVNPNAYLGHAFDLA